MNAIFEKYLLGEMNADEAANLERALAEDSSLREAFERDRALFEALQNQMLRRKIALALSEAGDTLKPVPKQARRNIWLWAGGTAAVILAAWATGFYFFSSSPKNKTPLTAPALPSTDTVKPAVHLPAAKEPAIERPPNEIKKSPPHQPIAQVVEPHSLAKLRGGVNTSRTPWASLVESIWYAPLPMAPQDFGAVFSPATELLSKGEFANAFTQLQNLDTIMANNDTLLFLKGFCLMQIWEGDAALHRFEPLMKKTSAWSMDLDWYAGLCYMAAGKKREAITVFEKIARTNKHRHQLRAKRALELLH